MINFLFNYWWLMPYIILGLSLLIPFIFYRIRWRKLFAMYKTRRRPGMSFGDLIGLAEGSLDYRRLIVYRCTEEGLFLRIRYPVIFLSNVVYSLEGYKHRVQKLP